MVQEFEIVTAFYTLVPWISTGFVILGLILLMALSIALGWYGGNKTKKSKKINTLFALGWIPIFGVFAASVFASSLVYYSSMDELKSQIKSNTGLTVVTFTRGDEKSFVTVDEDSKLMRCRVGDEKFSNTYTVRCK